MCGLYFAVKVFFLVCLSKYMINSYINYFKTNKYRKKYIFYFQSTAPAFSEDLHFCNFQLQKYYLH